MVWNFMHHWPMIKPIFMNPIELKRMGLTALDPGELLQTEGGGWLSRFFRKMTVAGVAYEIIQNWDEIKKGLKAGWNFDHQK
jgi:hypothetical protein